MKCGWTVPHFGLFIPPELLPDVHVGIVGHMLLERPADWAREGTILMKIPDDCIQAVVLEHEIPILLPRRQTTKRARMVDNWYCGRGAQGRTPLNCRSRGRDRSW